jgi:probable rRNA maturation factor
MAEGGPSRKRPQQAGARVAVEVLRRADAWSETSVNDALLKRAARAAIIAAMPKPGAYQLTLLLSDDSEMRELNRTWRGKYASTNVLSFPASDAAIEPGFIGDVVLAQETVRKEAREQAIPLEDHVAHLVVHGVLHLLGYDHEQDEDAEQMEILERKALASLGIADPYLEQGKLHAAEVS